MKIKLILLGFLLNNSYQVQSQNSEVLASLNIGYDIQVIGTVSNSIIFQDDLSIYISDGTISGTKIMVEINEDEKVLHQRTELNGKYYFTVGGASNYSIMEVDPIAQTMTQILSNQKKISGLIDYNGFLYFGLSDHPIHASSYMKMDVQTFELSEIFDLTPSGVEDAITHNGLIYLILKSNNASGTYLAKSNGEKNVLDEYFYLGDSEEGDIEPRRINMISAGDKLFFWHSLDYIDYTLYVTEGANANTLSLKSDFKRNSKHEYSVYKYRDITALGEKVYFSAQDGFGNATVSRLWVSDGSMNGTKELLFDGDGIESPGYFTNLENEIYFEGKKATQSGKETLLVISENNDIVEDAIDFSSPMNEIRQGGRHVVNHSGKLYFEAFGEDYRLDLYTKEPASNSITRLTWIEDFGQSEDFGHILSGLTSVGENLFFFVLNFEANSQLRLYKPQANSSTTLVNKAVSVYPNPATSQIKAEGVQDYNNIKIFDVFGREMTSSTFTNRLDINVSNLKTGLYFLEAHKKNSRIITSFIKI